MELGKKEMSQLIMELLANPELKQRFMKDAGDILKHGVAKTRYKNAIPVFKISQSTVVNLLLKTEPFPILPS